MSTEPPSASSSAFTLLHPEIQRWVWRNRWTDLRAAQERAVRPILAAAGDLVVCAATAAGKTEAAFLPICTALLRDREAADARVGGIEVVYVSPLKALINDQWNRLDGLCDDLEIPVHRWHGDVAASRKARAAKDPSGILLITPESLESLFVNRGPSMPHLMAGLRYLVIDEMHAFLGNPRGAQLQSLMHRLDLVVRRRTPRIALSATLGDLDVARAFLRPDDPAAVQVVEEAAGAGDVRLQVRGYLRQKPRRPDPGEDQTPPPDDGHDDEQDTWQIAEHLFRTLRGTTNLVFANRRADVELYTDRLAQLADRAGTPSDFLPHHGSLSREAREDVEARLREGSRPTTAICTSTLELGIDIGSVTSVAQLGAPPTVAALRQRLGRSGRRPGEVATLRTYVSEDEIGSESSPIDAIRAELFQTVASVDLLLDRWFEPQDDGNLHLSTLIQQVLSLIAQHGGVHPADAYQSLCQKGPFRRVTSGMFGQLLRDMGSTDLIMQAGDGLLLAGVHGERMINHYSFYPAFRTADEYRLVAGGKTLGSLPIMYAVEIGTRIIFGGRRWQVTAVHDKDKVIELVASAGGRPPKFNGIAAATALEVHHRMLMRYVSDDVPAYLDSTGQRLLDEGRANFRRWDLHLSPVMRVGRDTVLFPWRGDRVHETVAALLADQGLPASVEPVTINVPEVEPARVHEALQRICAHPPPDPIDLAARVPNKAVDKWDDYLGDDLLNAAFAARSLNVPDALRAIERLLLLWPDEEGTVAVPAPVTPVPAWSATIPGQRSREATARVADRPTLNLRDAVYSVVDLETTGLSPALGHRIVEIAIVRVDGFGNVLDRYATLVNPRRHPGPTRIHGLTASDLKNAPTFAEIAEDVAARLSGTVVTAHNAPFDLAFLDAEFGRRGLHHLTESRLCTLELAHRVAPDLPNHKLVTCCVDRGIKLTDAHQALADADAAAALLTQYLADLGQQHFLTLEDVAVLAPAHATLQLDLSPGRTPITRGDARPRGEPTSLVTSNGSPAGQILEFAASYVADEHNITAEELRELQLYAVQWQVPAEDREGVWQLAKHPR